MDLGRILDVVQIYLREISLVATVLVTGSEDDALAIGRHVEAADAEVFLGYSDLLFRIDCELPQVAPTAFLLTVGTFIYNYRIVAVLVLLLVILAPWFGRDEVDRL